MILRQATIFQKKNQQQRLSSQLLSCMFKQRGEIGRQKAFVVQTIQIQYCSSLPAVVLNFVPIFSCLHSFCPEITCGFVSALAPGEETPKKVSEEASKEPEKAFFWPCQFVDAGMPCMRQSTCLNLRSIDV